MPPATPPAPLTGNAPAPVPGGVVVADPPGGIPVPWSEVAKRNMMLAAMVRRAGWACQELQRTGEWRPKHAPPFSVQAAQRKLGSLLVPYPSIDRATLPRNTHFVHRACTTPGDVR